MATYTGSDKRLAYLFRRTEDMQGATSESDGAQGIIPKPKAGDNLKFLRGDGEWAEAQAGDPSRELTQEEYDALTEEEKMNGTTYYITDGENPPDEMALGNLKDVAINSPTDGQILKYDAENAEWVNGDETSVSVAQVLTSGTKAATVTIDGVDTDIYAPTPTDISGLETRMTAAEGNITSIQNQLVISKSVSGSAVTFTDGANAPLLACTAEIVAVQSGSGDPSPTNPRPIAGFTGCNITVSPTSDPNDGTVYPISWQTEAGTVYGGTVDFKTGVLTVTWAAIDMGSLSWGYNGTYKWFGASVSGSTKLNMCEIYRYDGECPNSASVIDATLNNKGFIYIPSNGRVTVRDYDFTTAAAFTTAVTGHYLIYQLAETITYQLTPTQVEALLGTNYISADTGDISLTYLTQPYQAIVDLIRTMT